VVSPVRVRVSPFAKACKDPDFRRQWLAATAAGRAPTGLVHAPPGRPDVSPTPFEQGITQSSDEAWSICLHNQALVGEDVIIGYDGRPRCAWAGFGDTAFSRYHDDVWGTRTDDESALFEALTLGVFEAGLSWSVVFGKRDAFRSAFHDFDAEQVAAMTERDIDRLLQGSLDHPQPRQDPGHHRQRARDAVRLAEPRGAREGLRAHTRACAAVRRRPLHVDIAGGRVRQAVEGAGVRLRGTDERVRVHAERRRGQ
jgi:hypothetical protein